MSKTRENKSFRGIKIQIDRKLKSQGLVLSEDETEYVDSARNISVVLGAEDLVKDFIDQGYSKSEETGGPSSKMFHTEARFQLKMKKMEKAMGSICVAEKMSETLDFDLLTTKAEAHLSMGDYRSALRTAETILCTKKQSIRAIRVKADSMFNLCDFEHALVTYYKGKKLAPGNPKFEKGIDNCEETINSLLENKEVFKQVGTILFADKIAKLNTQTKFSMKIVAANKFKSYKDDKIKKDIELIESGKQIKKKKVDRLGKDKEFLTELVKVEGFRPHKRR
jgi:tetratricopeptide (TPR) repeat protein